MPVRQHRASWTGGPEVVVAALLEDHTVPAGFTTTGAPYRFTSAEEEPEAPTLALVPIETNFSNPPEPGTYRNTSDMDGLAIGIYSRVRPSLSTSETCDPETAVMPCDGEIGGSTSINWSNLPTGLYMTAVYIPHDYEGAFKGNPEFETHLQAPVGDPAVAEDIRCAGENAPDPRSHYN